MSPSDDDLALSDPQDRVAHQALLAWGRDQRAAAGGPPSRFAQPLTTEPGLHLARDVNPNVAPGRRSRRAAVAALAVAASVAAVGAVAFLPNLLLSVQVTDGPTGSQQPVASRDQRVIQAIRTSPDGRSLVVNYIGGACDGTPRLTAEQERTTVRLRLVVPPDGQDACPDIGISRTVAVELDAPVGSRKIVSGDRVLIPFDGARLLRPSSLPPSYTARRESGYAPDSGDPDGVSTSVWSQVFAEPERPPTSGGACGPGRAPLLLAQGPVGHQFLSPEQWKQIGTTRVGDARAQVLQGTYFDGMALGRALVWNAAGGSVALTSQPGCAGDEIASQAELEQVAGSLQPASQQAGPKASSAARPDDPEAPSAAQVQALISRMRELASEPSSDAVRRLPFAETVRLGLGGTLVKEVDAERLADRSTWDVAVTPEFAWQTNPTLSALDHLTDPRAHTAVSGPHPHCAGPPRPAPEPLSAHSRVSSQPSNPESCLSWYTVDLFLRDGKIEAVTLDLWEP